MSDRDFATYGALLLRLGLGVMFLAHNVLLKALVYTLPGTAAFFASVGLPGVLAYLVFAVELIGGVLLILGVGVCWVALALLPVLLGATWVHWPNGWLFTNANGGFEYPLFLALAALVQALLARTGAGRPWRRPEESHHESHDRGRLAHRCRADACLSCRG